MKNVEDSIQEGWLWEYVNTRRPREERPQRSPRRPTEHRENRWPERQEERQPEVLEERPLPEIQTIAREPATGDSNRARKAYDRTPPLQIMNLGPWPKKLSCIEKITLSFWEDEPFLIYHSHTDSLVVALLISNHRVQHILVDGGSSTDILYLSLFEKWGSTIKTWSPLKLPSLGSTGGVLVQKEV